MKIPIHEELLNHPDAIEFAELAEKYCNLIERLDELPKAGFLRQLQELLPLMYSRGHRLSDPYDWPPNDDDEEYEREHDPGHLPNPTEAWRDWEPRLNKKLEPHQFFRFVFDPYEPTEPEAIVGGLGDILSQTYIGLKRGLIAFRRPSSEDKAWAIWEWWFGMNLDWGSYVAEAMLPIHRLIHTHYDEDDEVFR